MSLTDATYIESLKKCTLPLRAENDLEWRKDREVGIAPK
jgi:hypothetical protein